MKRSILSTIIASLIAASPVHAIMSSSATDYEVKSATAITTTVNADVKKSLPFSDTSDFVDANRGFIADLASGEILGSNGKPVYSMSSFNFLEGQAPDTTNPSLWRQSILNATSGLFEVTEGIYQVRAWDLANISFIRGDSGWIIVDPLLSTETASAALELVREKVEDLPVSAVILTHSHGDHFGGVRGVISEEDIESGKVPVIAPDHFFEESVNEHLMAGNQMSRRASYMYGNLLEKSPTGTLGSGLGTTTSSGEFTIVKPTVEIGHTPTHLNIDGVEMEFMYTPGAEAPAELMFYLPEFNALMQAEEINKTMHNLYTLRGAQVRSGLDWSKYIQQTIENYGDEVEISFGSHHWPTWGNERIVDYWEGQRDTYRYIHDETLRLANHGMTMLEVAESVKLPESLSSGFANRGYYGSVSHNAKAQYQLYYGWFSGNPAELNELPPVEEGQKFIEYMGGSDNILEKARADFIDGEYRWVATALNHVVFAEPDNQEAKNLLADTLEQMGYQAESGPWRNFYLSGAKELRQGVMAVATPSTTSPDIVKNLNLETYLDYLGVRLNHPEAAGKELSFNVVMPDINQQFTLNVENGVLNYTMNKQMDHPQATIRLDRSTLDAINLQQTKVADAIDAGDVKIFGDQDKVNQFISLLDVFPFWFNIVTP
ncbi:alkyl/aryl-sulfatase [Endozoicomonas ascidiicola]|uniref:alkyl/aryl-sulfatase n=1 Tax=Endozoicomonas ascidiicola TaxID=1698521 RepID=UPI00082AED21|nr:alkyl sulfatase dimerization domain-containing protein [Endozoicomonas ascidiicola]